MQVLIKNKKLNTERIKVKIYIVFFMLWFIYAVISLLWSASLEDGIKDILYLFTAISLILFSIRFLSHREILNHVSKVLLLILFIMIVIGLWENVTGNHLPGDRELNLTNYYRPRAVFTDENVFSTFLSCFMFFIVSFVKTTNKNVYRIFGGVLLLLSIYLMIVTFSRANYFALVLGFGYLFFMLAKLREKVKIISLLLFGGALLIISFFDTIKELADVYILGVTSVISSEQVNDSSVSVRLNLLKNSIYFIRESFGFGVGAGNAEYYMAKHSIYNTYGIVNVHNWWVEIAVNYGLLIFFGYLTVYLSLIFNLTKIYSKLLNKIDKRFCEGLIGGLVSFSISSISPSSLIGVAFQWLLFAFAIGFLNYLRNTINSYSITIRLENKSYKKNET
ncbi:O-antigen ligase family protein [Cohnella cellulosilytica]